MKFRLENLPITTLLEVFSFVESEELLDLRFLNKNLFKIIGTIIQVHLSYSTYHDINYFIDIQDDFIKKKSSSMKHLIVTDGKLFNYSNMRESNSVINNNFNNLKGLTIKCFKVSNVNIITLLNLFKSILFKVETFKLCVDYDIILEEFVYLLNPDLISFVSIYNPNSSIIINDVSIFQYLRNLKQLDLIITQLDIKLIEPMNSNIIIFPSLEKLILVGCFGLYIDFKWFGDMKLLNFIELALSKYEMATIQYIKENNNLNKVNLFYFLYEYESIEINNILYELYPILEIKRVKKLVLIGLMNNVFKEYNENINLFLYINEIMFYDCICYIQFIFNLLVYFPNIKKISFENTKLSNHNNHPLLLPNNINFLFCIDKKSLNNSDPTILNLLGDINTFIY